MPDRPAGDPRSRARRPADDDPQEPGTAARVCVEFNSEWGVGKTIKTLDAGVSGYCDWQVTADSGSDWANSGLRDRSFAIGPEVHYFFPEQKVGLQFRTWWEFGARDRSQGQITTLTLVKPF